MPRHMNVFSEEQARDCQTRKPVGPQVSWRITIVQLVSLPELDTCRLVGDFKQLFPRRASTTTSRVMRVSRASATNHTPPPRPVLTKMKPFGSRENVA